MVYGYNKAANAYKTNSVNYASKDQLLLMLVDGAVKFSKKAEYSLEERNVTGAHTNLRKTQDIFYELMATLDKDAAGEWGQNIYDLYEFITDRLGEANIKKDIKILQEVMPLIEEVKSIWNEAYRISKSGK